CHIDISRPYRPAWRFVRGHVAGHDASIFSLARFPQRLPPRQYLGPPGLDPLSDKTRDIPEAAVNAAWMPSAIDAGRPRLVRVSRFDGFKDPAGVVQAYRQARQFAQNGQLAVAGRGATDDPEGETVLADVRAAAGDDPVIHVLKLPPDVH